VFLVQLLIDGVIVASWVVQIRVIIKLKLGWLKLISLVEFSIAKNSGICSRSVRSIIVKNLAFYRLLRWLKVAISIGGVPTVLLIFSRVRLIIIITLLFFVLPAASE
jgi:hypothetical protein